MQRNVLLYCVYRNFFLNITFLRFQNLGIARQWIKSKMGNKSGSKIYQVFEDIDSDSVSYDEYYFVRLRTNRYFQYQDEYLRYLFSCFPAIRDYIQQFHRN